MVLSQSTQNGTVAPVRPSLTAPPSRMPRLSHPVLPAFRLERSAVRPERALGRILVDFSLIVIAPDRRAIPTPQAGGG